MSGKGAEGVGVKRSNFFPETRSIEMWERKPARGNANQSVTPTACEPLLFFIICIMNCVIPTACPFILKKLAHTKTLPLVEETLSVEIKVSSHA